MACLPVANQNGMILLSPTSTSTEPELLQAEQVVRLKSNDHYQAAAAAMLMDRERVETAIPVFMNETYGIRLAAGIV